MPPARTLSLAAAQTVGDPDLKVNDSPVVTAATLPPPRRFYVTSTNYLTNAVLTACAAGYHMGLDVGEKRGQVLTRWTKQQGQQPLPSRGGTSRAGARRSGISRCWTITQTEAPPGAP